MAEAIKEEKQSQEISSPEGAAFVAEQDLYDGADQTAALMATVHKTQTGSAGNIWQRNSGVAHKLLPQRNLNSEPRAEMLVGEVNRLTQKLSENKKDLDQREKLGLIGLHNDAMNQIKR